MKKVFLALSVIALMVAVSACGNKTAKTAEAAEEIEAAADCCGGEMADTTACSGACADSTSCCE